MRIEGVAVIIPAKDERDQIDACLRATLAALQPIRSLDTIVILVDDDSSDGTGILADELLRGQPHLIIRQETPNVGRARAAGVSAAIKKLSHLSPGSVWLAFTDADTMVSADWLSKQIAWAEAGAAAVRGIVRLIDSVHPNFELAYAAHVWPYGHRHVHGANMGMTARSYLDAGGIPSLSVGEDVALWRQLSKCGAVVIADSNLVVETSARRKGRAEGGFATLLASLDCGEPSPSHADPAQLPMMT